MPGDSVRASQKPHHTSPRRGRHGPLREAACCSSSDHAPLAKSSQRRSSSAGGTRASPAARKRSMRGARQNSFQPRSSSCGDTRSAMSCKPARSAVRNAPRSRVGTPCKVRLRWRKATSRVIASREASSICMPAAAAAVRLSAAVLRAGTSEEGTSLAEAAGTPGCSWAVEATGPWRPRPRPPRRPRPVVRIAAAAVRAETSRWDCCPPASSCCRAASRSPTPASSSTRPGNARLTWVCALWLTQGCRGSSVVGHRWRRLRGVGRCSTRRSNVDRLGSGKKLRAGHDLLPQGPRWWCRGTSQTVDEAFQRGDRGCAQGAA